MRSQYVETFHCCFTGLKGLVTLLFPAVGRTCVSAQRLILRWPREQRASAIRRLITVNCLFLLMLVLSGQLQAETVYRYQDEKGRWHFTDKKPKRQHDELEVLQNTPQKPVPELRWVERNNRQQLVAFNPWFTPVQFELWQNGERHFDWVVDARKDEPVEVDKRMAKILAGKWNYRYRMGRPINRGDGAPLRPPVPPQGRYRISQGFNGHFSHNKAPSLHAVDIVMAMTDEIHAARDGIVVMVKDDYHMGGTDPYFLDKANFVTVLHGDDTYAVYAHILLGSALVREGQRVKAGDPLANAGTSGFSTGSHLHFVLQHNTGKATASLPFVFSSGNGGVQKPVARQWLSN